MHSFWSGQSVPNVFCDHMMISHSLGPALQARLCQANFYRENRYNSPIIMRGWGKRNRGDEHILAQWDYSASPLNLYHTFHLYPLCKHFSLIVYNVYILFPQTKRLFSKAGTMDWLFTHMTQRRPIK